MSNQLQNFINYLVITKNINSSEKAIILQKEIYSIQTIILKSNYLSPRDIQNFIIEKTNTYYDELDKNHLIQIYKEMEAIPLYSHLHSLHNYLVMKRNRLLYDECGKNLANHIIKNILFEIY
ncbi:MAG: hypothetical protein ACRDCE_18905 [Cetobacterium sp.]|uniref:hypothetical protein n=1 Tax=Cetobacterium TaxID=180162 RepID=UPI001F052313|nr:hypothetical protein [Cetobacterium somerae]MCX3066000.1 hypothetical protein [Cetobacterium somerae]UPO96459.1 hypothetical protein MKD34_04670 [Cetobacterium somerae]